MGLNKIEATFLMWLDCTNLGTGDNPSEFFAKNAKVQLNNGASFGKGFEKYVRLNFGTNRKTLEEALERMKSSLSR